MQIGCDSFQFDNFLPHDNVHNVAPLVSDFSDTAHLISQLDLVISVDTAVAHLSSSLQCPTWVMLPYSSDFRWLMDSNHSPWYSTSMRLIRQQSEGDWSSVVNTVNTLLDELFMIDVDKLYNAKFP